MATTTRVTVTLPTGIIEEIDRLEKNRSRFVLKGVRRELEWRRREALRQSLRDPHAESEGPSDEGFAEWANSLPAEDVSDLVDLDAGTPVRWIPGSGWEMESE